MTKWTNETIAESVMEIAMQYYPIRMPSNREVIEQTGNRALSCAIQKNGGFAYWAKTLGLEQKYSETKVGIECEKDIANRLRSEGYKVSETPIKHPYDLLIDGCVKVDVKVANTSYVNGSGVHAYRLAKKQHTCDFYICCEKDGLKDIYVIPANMVTGQIQIEMGTRSEKYSHYRDAFYLIKDAVNFYNSLVVPY